MTAPTAAAEPLHITAAMAQLAQLRDTFHLPHPVGVRITKSNGIATIELPTFAGVVAWAQAIGVTNQVTSSSFSDGSTAHSVWSSWNGWDVRVAAYVDAPEVVAVVPGRAGCPNGCDELLADTDCPEHGVVAFVKANLGGAS